MEDTIIMEDYESTLPLHLQRIESNYPKHERRNSGDESDGMAIVFPDRHRRRPSSMSKRISITANTTNGYGYIGEANSTPIERFYASNETASTSSLSSLSQTEHKYIRRKKKKCGCQNKNKPLGGHLVLMMAALAVLSCSFTFYSTLSVFTPTNTAMDYFSDGLNHTVHRSKDNRPRIVMLELGHFDSNVIRSKHNQDMMAYPFFAKLVELPANISTMIDDNVSFKIETAAAAEPEPAATKKILVVPSPPSTTAKVEKNCLPMAKWMTASYPNCNSIHEIDMQYGVVSMTYDEEDDLKFLGQGWFRDTWKYVNDNIEGSPPVVLKTLRIEREFLDEYFDLHRRDAVAMERLTFSPYVVNVHGYCGQSAINELAQGIADGKINNLEQLNRRLRGKESDPQALYLKLQLATKVSLGLAHVHNIHVSDNSGGRSKSVKSLLYEHTDPNSSHSTTGFGRSVSTMAHYDINPRNIAIMSDGSPKLNDFNIAEFLTYDPQTNLTCGFRSRLHEPWWRAPEEMDTSHQTFVDEKVDLYALGEVLFHTLTTHGPRGKMTKARMEEVRAKVKQGIRPDMWEPFASGGEDGSLKKNPIVKAFMKAMDMCFEMDPTKRATSIQVARVLHKALMKEQAAREQAKEDAARQER